MESAAKTEKTPNPWSSKWLCGLRRWILMTPDLKILLAANTRWFFFDKESNYSWAKFLTKQNTVFFYSDQGQIQNPWFPQIILWPEAVNPDDPVLVPRLQAVSHLTKPDKTIIFDKNYRWLSLIIINYLKKIPLTYCQLEIKRG